MSDKTLFNEARQRNLPRNGFLICSSTNETEQRHLDEVSLLIDCSAMIRSDSFAMLIKWWFAFAKWFLLRLDRVWSLQANLNVDMQIEKKLIDHHWRRRRTSSVDVIIHKRRRRNSLQNEETFLDQIQSIYIWKLIEHKLFSLAFGPAYCRPRRRLARLFSHRQYVSFSSSLSFFLSPFFLLLADYSTDQLLTRRHTRRLVVE